MATAQPSRINIYELIERREIEIVFQPIVSIRRGAIVGVEALSRGLNSNGHHIQPAQLFKLAKIAGLTDELDRLCRMVAVESFLPLYASNPELILFINVDPTAIGEIAAGSDSFVNFLRQKNLNPRNVAIEIVEEDFGSLTQIEEIVSLNKEHGFLTVLDNIGIGHSNLDRIAKIRPDILKVDRALVHNLHLNSHQQEVLKALVNLSERIGGWVIVEGVEQQEEAIQALDLGADMLQGFYLARPHRIASGHSIELELPKLQDTATKFKSYTIDKIRLTQAQRQQRLSMIEAIASQLQAVKPATFDFVLAELIHQYPAIVSVCVLDLDGVQISETVRNPRQDEIQKTVIFKPPAKGTNHSLKEYYYLLSEAQIDPFETAPYVPLPSSNLCVTLSTKFENIEGNAFILCLHIELAAL